MGSQRVNSVSLMKNKIEEYARLTQERLSEELVVDEVPYMTLLDSMSYSTLAGGKRVRPYLVLEFCELCGVNKEKALNYAAAAEMIHTFSLIHDDLPGMDNDDYRRGRLTNHRVFGEATAILAGDALVFKAIETSAKSDLTPKQNVEAIKLLCKKSGAHGMCGGQQIDLEGEKRPLGKEEILLMYKMKTCDLLSMSCQLGVIAANGSESEKRFADHFGEYFGKAFQIIDDLLDMDGDPLLLGKSTGSDEKNEKSTLVKYIGKDKAIALASDYSERAKDMLYRFNDCEARTRLFDFCDKMLRRKR